MSGITILSVLLCIAVGLLWWRSYRHADFVAFFTPSGKIQGIASHRGKVLVTFTNVSFGSERGLTAVADSAPAGDFEEVRQFVFDGATYRRQRWGFGVSASAPGDLPGAGKQSTICVPEWFLVGLLAIGPSMWAPRAVRRRRRMRRGLCGSCGYDLRFSEGRCPECGAAVSRQSSGAADMG